MLAIDIDSVTAEIIPVLLRMQNEKHGTDYCIDDVRDWHQKFKEFNMVTAIHELFDSTEWMDIVEPVNGAERCIPMLDAHAVEFAFVTNRNTKYARTTAEWINKYFGPRPIMHTKETKKLCFFSTLLDDSPINIIDFKQRGGTPIVFDRPWNRNIPHITRAGNWSAAIDLILDGHRR